MKVEAMKKAIMLCMFGFTVLLVPEFSLGQAFGEYGRAVGNVPRGPNIAPGGAASSAPGTIGAAGLGNLDSRVLPPRLVVASKMAGLFPRQDDEMEKITQLSEGEKLVPLIQSEGSIPWYMVRTEKGIIGWVRSADVRKDELKKKQ
jgi:hypothetical protein